MAKIQSFTDLDVWKKAHRLVIDTYDLLKRYPQNEQFALTDQMRRCAISISSNIAEGFSRQSRTEKLQFYYISKGSLTELQNQLLISRDVKYISTEEFKQIAEQSVVVGKYLTGLIRSAKAK